MSRKFQLGDRVTYNGSVAEIIKLNVPVPYGNNGMGATIEFENKNLIPPTMDVPYDKLIYFGPKKQQGLPVGQANTASPFVKYDDDDAVELDDDLDVSDFLMGQPIFGDDKKEECVIHDWVEKPLFTSTYTACSKCGKERPSGDYFFLRKGNQ